jgi:DNA-binding MarR family transcriptional regulator
MAPSISRVAAGAVKPGVDLGPLSESVGYGLQRAQLAVRSAVVAVLAEVELSPGRFGVLSVIERNPGLSQADACTALGIQATNITPLLGDLERRGLIARRTSPRSRRTKMLELTPAGKRRLQLAVRLHQALEQRIARSLGPGRRELLVELLDKLAGTQ